jgi:predicted tellurium resistance membrane protein TerC
MHWLQDAEIWASLLTLTALEIVLGIDNIVFISILAGRMPPERRPQVRRVGLSLALLTRLALLASISWIIGLTRPLFELMGQPVSWRDMVLIGGGLFLVYKGTVEIHHRMEEAGESPDAGSAQATFAGIVTQIAVLDVVFSLDSVITAIGMAEHLWVMATAIVLAVAVMLWASGPLSEFVERHPTVKMLALAFLLLIGMALIADGAGFHVPKGYIYAAIGFSVLVEALNQLVAGRGRRRRAVSRASGRAGPPGPG